MKNFVPEDEFFPQRERIKSGKSYSSPQKITRKVKQEKKLYEKRQKLKKKRQAFYAKYLDSKAWLLRKHRYYSRHAKKCAVCQTKKNITLHHMSYRNLGNEKDDDLIPLCHSHHDEYHATYTNINKETTYKFIQEKQDELSAKSDTINL